MAQIPATPKLNFYLVPADRVYQLSIKHVKFFFYSPVYRSKLDHIDQFEPNAETHNWTSFQNLEAQEIPTEENEPC